jgi:hypothetical protein
MLNRTFHIRKSWSVDGRRVPEQSAWPDSTMSGVRAICQEGTFLHMIASLLPDGKEHEMENIKESARATAASETVVKQEQEDRGVARM